MDSPDSTPEIEYRKFWEARGINNISGGLIDYSGAIDRIKVTRKHTMSSACASVYTLGIQSDGIIPLCCIDFNASVKIGDAKEQTIKEIYNDKIIRNLRKKLADDDVSSLPCARCKYEDFLIKKQYPFLGSIRYLISVYMGRRVFAFSRLKRRVKSFFKKI